MRNLIVNNRVVSASWAPASYEPSYPAYESGTGFYIYDCPIGG